LEGWQNNREVPAAAKLKNHALVEDALKLLSR